MTKPQSLKETLDFRQLVQETHQLTKSSKLNCLWHEDKTPSLHIYQDGYYCFVCGVSGDHFDWLERVKGLAFQEAVSYLEHFSSITSNHFTKAVTFEPRKPKQTYRVIPPNIAKSHDARVKRLERVPKALENHGFTLRDCKQLQIANDKGNAIFPIKGPEGRTLALKRRYLKSQPHRYDYLTKSHGTPAWCSPNRAIALIVLIVEGELNGMMCWLALKKPKQIAVMGTAGVNASFYQELVLNKTIYIYADADTAGQAAKQRWAEQASNANAKKVYQLESWQRDACEIVSYFGKRSLREKLLWGQKHHYIPNEVDANPSLSAKVPSSKQPVLPKAKPDLMQSCTGYEELFTKTSIRPTLKTAPSFNPSCHDAS